MKVQYFITRFYNRNRKKTFFDRKVWQIFNLLMAYSVIPISCRT